MDYYKTLLLSRTATQEEIQKAYHALALKFHPDANPGDTEAAEKFKVINKAYQTLRNPEKRKEYDATLGGAKPGAATKKAASPNSASSTRVGGTMPTSGMTGNPLADVLGDLRNAARGNAAAQAGGANLKDDGTPTIELKLTRREAVTGTVKTVLINGRRLRIQITIER